MRFELCTPGLTQHPPSNGQFVLENSSALEFRNFYIFFNHRGNPINSIWSQKRQKDKDCLKFI